jgi:hypothetical protein
VLNRRPSGRRSHVEQTRISLDEVVNPHRPIIFDRASRLRELAPTRLHAPGCPSIGARSGWRRLDHADRPRRASAPSRTRSQGRCSSRASWAFRMALDTRCVERRSNDSGPPDCLPSAIRLSARERSSADPGQPLRRALMIQNVTGCGPVQARRSRSRSIMTPRTLLRRLDGHDA